MRAGDTFYIADRGVDSHLWVVISDPDKDPDQVVMVSMTTYEGHKEDVCILNAGDHPRVSHKTCIAYEHARQTTLGKLVQLRDAGCLVIQPPVSEEILKKIRDGVSLSKRIMYKYIEVLIEQEVIE